MSSQKRHKVSYNINISTNANPSNCLAWRRGPKIFHPSNIPRVCEKVRCPFTDGGPITHRLRGFVLLSCRVPVPVLLYFPFQFSLLDISFSLTRTPSIHTSLSTCHITWANVTLSLSLSFMLSVSLLSLACKEIVHSKGNATSTLQQALSYTPKNFFLLEYTGKHAKYHALDICFIHTAPYYRICCCAHVAPLPLFATQHRHQWRLTRGTNAALKRLPLPKDNKITRLSPGQVCIHTGAYVCVCMLICIVCAAR